MSSIQPLQAEKNYPFVQEFVTDSNGQIQKVILSIEDYQQLLELLEDESFYHMMHTVRHETPLSREDALVALEIDD